MKKGDSITLSSINQRRLLILNHLEVGAIVNAQAASLLGLSVRQVRRLRGKYRDEGAAVLVHGNRGRRPVHALDPAVAARIVELAKTKYAGFNQHHLTEMLGEQEGLTVSRPSVYRILKAAGIAAPRRRRPSRHCRRRDRYPRAGMLLQIDGSWHDWLEGRGPWLSLVGGIDDATGMVPWATFREREDAQGYFELLRAVVRRHGIPWAVYSDRHGIFFKAKAKELTLDEALAGRAEPTQFARLLEELGVELILARSPQAKGRVERLWGTFQDRLASELRLAGARTAADAEAVLHRYLPRHNRRFAVPAADPAGAWIPWPKGRRADDVLLLQVPSGRRQGFHRATARPGDRPPAQPPADQLRAGGGGGTRTLQWPAAGLSPGQLSRHHAGRRAENRLSCGRAVACSRSRPSTDPSRVDSYSHHSPSTAGSAPSHPSLAQLLQTLQAMTESQNCYPDRVTELRHYVKLLHQHNL
jgi:transposase